MITKDEFESLFNKYARTDLGTIQDLREIEKRLVHLREGGLLKYGDLELIADPKYWPFRKYWIWPAKDSIENMLAHTKGWFKLNNLSTEKRLWTQLLGIFKNIELVSIVLRFALPEYYAICSKPLLKLLRCNRGYDAIEEYSNFILDIRVLKNSFSVENASEVDTIIWVIFKARGRYLTEFNNILARTLPNNLSPRDLLVCLQDDPIRVARAYHNNGDFNTAGLWALRAYEKFLSRELDKLLTTQPHRISADEKPVEFLIKTNRFWGNSANSELLREARDKRNKVAHGGQYDFQYAEDFINLINQLLLKSNYSNR